MKSERERTFPKPLTGFDYFVLAGALMNILVILYLVGYWMIYG